jgi:hypothetical protein
VEKHSTFNYRGNYLEEIKKSYRSRLIVEACTLQYSVAA